MSDRSCKNSSEKESRLPQSRAVMLADLVQVSPGSIVSRELARTGGGTVTLFAFAAGEGLSEHTAPFDALVQVVAGELELVIGGEPLRAGPGEMVLMPARVPHALKAGQDSKMLLTMLRDSAGKE